MERIVRIDGDDLQREISDATALRFEVVDPETGETVPELSRTKQSEAEQADINNIMGAALRNGGLVSHVNQFKGEYADVSQGISFQESMNNVIRGQEMFGSLPADLRAEFHNDPGEFLDFVINPANKARMRELGLLKPEPVVTQAAPAASAAPGSTT